MKVKMPPSRNQTTATVTWALLRSAPVGLTALPLYVLVGLLRTVSRSFLLLLPSSPTWQLYHPCCLLFPFSFSTCFISVTNIRCPACDRSCFRSKVNRLDGRYYKSLNLSVAMHVYSLVIHVWMWRAAGPQTSEWGVKNAAESGARQGRKRVGRRLLRRYCWRDPVWKRNSYYLMCLVMTHNHELLQAESLGLERLRRGCRDGNRLAGGRSFHCWFTVYKTLNTLHLHRGKGWCRVTEGMREQRSEDYIYFWLSDHQPDNKMTGSLGWYQNI